MAEWLKAPHSKDGWQCCVEYHCVLPVGTVAGCPAGLSLIAWAGGDEVLLDLAVSLARYCGIAL
jgi:Asp-tRNA(Asn)/Glu-tRNA(Gln) amidotransferase A subunit family amidase